MRWPWTRTAEAAQLATRQAVNLSYATDGRDILFNSPDGWEVDQPWLWFTDPDGTWGNPPPGARGDPEGFTSLPAVARCTSIICDTLAGLPWEVLRGWDRLDRPDWISDPQALRLDSRIVGAAVDDVRFSAVEFWSTWIRSALWFGDGFVYCPVRGANGQPVPPLWLIHPDYVQVDTDAMRYVVEDVTLPEGSVLHLRGGEINTDTMRGTGVLALHASDFGLALSTRKYAGTQYRAGVPNGYLKAQQQGLTQEQADRLKAAWMRQHGRGGRSIAVLNATTEFVPINISPLDAQLDSARQWSLRDIALAFGVPPYMLGVPGDSSTYANVESRMIELRMFTLLPWARRIESVLDAEFARGTNLKIKTAGLERADTQTRYAAYTTALNAGFLTVDEVRALEDLRPIEDVAPASVPPPLSVVGPPPGGPVETTAQLETGTQAGGQ